MSQILTWHASHDSLNTREKFLAVGKAYGMSSIRRNAIKNGIQFYLESAKRRIYSINRTRSSNCTLPVNRGKTETQKKSIQILGYVQQKSA